MGMLLAYNSAGDVVSTLDYVVEYDDDGNPLGIVDFEAHEDAGGEMDPDVWHVEGRYNEADPATAWTAAGSKTWPEWLGSAAHEFRVELVGPPGRKRIGALVHKSSGHRRERAQILAAIEARKASTPPGQAIDLRDLVGGPSRPLPVDTTGRTVPRHNQGPSGRPLVGLPR